MTGKIPTANEYQYLKSHASSYGIDIKKAEKLANQLKAKKERKLSEAKRKELKEKLKDESLTDQKRRY